MLEELVPVFDALERLGHPCVLIGGQSVCHWARRYRATELALQAIERLTPLLSKDVDFHGAREAAMAIARAFHTKALVPGFRDAFGNLMAGKFTVQVGNDRLSVEVLRKVPGLTLNEVSKLSMMDSFGRSTLRVLNPVGVMLAKAWNVANIPKEGRRDAEHLLISTVCVRAFLRSLLASAGDERAALRLALKLAEHILAFTELPVARKAAARCGVDWSQVLPHATIAFSTQSELVRLREKRLPLWLMKIAGYEKPLPANATICRLLEILATHAEPPCARPAPTPRPSSLVPRPSP